MSKEINPKDILHDRIAEGTELKEGIVEGAVMPGTGDPVGTGKFSQAEGPDVDLETAIQTEGAHVVTANGKVLVNGDFNKPQETPADTPAPSTPPVEESGDDTP